MMIERLLQKTKSKSHLAIIMGILLLGCLIKSLLCAGETRAQHDSDIAQTIINLHKQGYVPIIEVNKPACIPDVKPEVIESTLVGYGEVLVLDTILPVSVEFVKPLDSSPFIKVRVGDSMAVFDSIEYYAPEGPKEARGLRIATEACMIGLDIEAGLGLAYNALNNENVVLGPAIIVGDLWVAGEVRFGKYISRNTSIDGAVGYRFFESQGVHYALGISIGL